MTTPTRQSESDDMEGLPVVQGTWVTENTSDVTSGLRAELLGTEPGNDWDGEQEQQQQGAFSDKKHDSSSFGKPQGFTMSTGGGDGDGNGSYQQYWGRFNDPTAEVLPDHDNGAIPVAMARPDDRQIRLAFIRKVYTILSAQLLVTFAMCAWMALNASMREFTLRSGGGTVLLYTNMVLMFALICFLHAYKRTYPHNYIILSVFTLSMSYIVGFVCAAYEEAGIGDLVIEAVFITATVFVVLTIFTLQSKWDFSFLGAGLGVCLWIMILWGFFSMIFGFQTGSVYALLGSILFSLYIIYDTYMICERLDPEDYIVAAIELYLDLINLFLYILQLLSDNRR